jgi:hypothetical protein
MHHARPVLAALVAASLMSLVPAAFGHGDSGHGKPKAVDYSKAEETPFGRAGDPKKTDRTIRVGMEDTMHFVALARRGSAQPTCAWAMPRIPCPATSW